MQSLYPNHPTTWHGQTYCILLRLETLSSLVLTLPFRTLHTFSFHKAHLVSSLKCSYDPLLLLQSSLQFPQSTDPFLYLADIFMMAFLTDTIFLYILLLKFLIFHILNWPNRLMPLVGCLPGILLSPKNQCHLLPISHCHPGAQSYLVYHYFPRE